MTLMRMEPTAWKLLLEKEFCCFCCCCVKSVSQPPLSSISVENKNQKSPPKWHRIPLNLVESFDSQSLALSQWLGEEDLKSHDRQWVTDVCLCLLGELRTWKTQYRRWSDIHLLSVWKVTSSVFRRQLCLPVHSKDKCLAREKVAIRSQGEASCKDVNLSTPTHLQRSTASTETVVSVCDVCKWRLGAAYLLVHRRYYLPFDSFLKWTVQLLEVSYMTIKLVLGDIPGNGWHSLWPLPPPNSGSAEYCENIELKKEEKKT